MSDLSRERREIDKIFENNFKFNTKETNINDIIQECSGKALYKLVKEAEQKLPQEPAFADKQDDKMKDLDPKEKDLQKPEKKIKGNELENRPSETEPKKVDAPLKEGMEEDDETLTPPEGGEEAPAEAPVEEPTEETPIDGDDSEEDAEKSVEELIADLQSDLDILKAKVAPEEPIEEPGIEGGEGEAPVEEPVEEPAAGEDEQLSEKKEEEEEEEQDEAKKKICEKKVKVETKGKGLPAAVAKKFQKTAPAAKVKGETTQASSKGKIERADGSTPMQGL